MNLRLTGSRRGMALLVVVVLTMLIALGAYRYTFYMESQYRLTRLHEDQVHARLAALSGIEYAASLLELSLNDRSGIGGLVENPTLMQSVDAAGIPAARSDSKVEVATWRFALVAAPLQGASESETSSGLASSLGENVLRPRFGFENESAKLHLPTLLTWDRRLPGHARTTLLTLPGATEEIVDAWLRKLGIVRPNNAASPMLDRLQASNNEQPTHENADQLNWLWFGGDLNQNFRLDPLEQQLGVRLLNQQGTMNRASTIQAGLAATPNRSLQSENTSIPVGWQQFLTWESGQRNENRNGERRINLNDANLQALHQSLTKLWPTDWANFVIALRQYGPAAGASPASSTNSALESPAPDFSRPPIYSLQSPLDLIGVVVQIPSTSQPASPSTGNATPPTNAKQTLRNPFSSDLAEVRNYLGKVLDEATTDPAPYSVGRIDVTDAPAEVLVGVPGIDASLAQRIVQQRSSRTNNDSTAPPSIAWLLESNLVDIVKLKQIEPYLTHRSDVYRVQSIGYRDDRTPVYRCSVTLDARSNPTEIRNLHVWHTWDRGFTTEQLDSVNR